jgi:hypothetical protein
MWGNQFKNAVFSFLLKQDGGYLLLQDGGRIILDQTGWSNQTKN